MPSRPWWQYPVTQPYGTPEPGFGSGVETGVDIGTPQGTPLTAIFGGTVKRTVYGPFGGEVDIATTINGKPFTETFLHLDQINPNLQIGQAVQPGSFLGFSGGQLSGGSHPASPAYSTGPHTEFDLFQGAAWSGKSINPMPVLNSDIAQAADRAVTQAMPAGGSDFGNLLDLSLPGGVGVHVGNPVAPIAAVGATIADSVASIPTQIGHGLADFFVVTEQDIAEWFKRQSVAFFVAAVVLLVLFL